VDLEKLKKRVRKCRRKLRGPEAKGCVQCPFESEIVNAYPRMVMQFRKARLRLGLVKLNVKKWVVRRRESFNPDFVSWHYYRGSVEQALFVGRREENIKRARRGHTLYTRLCGLVKNGFEWTTDKKYAHIFADKAEAVGIAVALRIQGLERIQVSQVWSQP
jgi:hypothetical protein